MLPYILNQSTEVLCLIFAYLDLLDLHHCSLSCKRFCRVIDDSIELQLLMQLGIHRMVWSKPPFGETSLSASARLEVLKQHQDAWRYLRLNSDEFPSISTARHDLTSYEYAGSVFSFRKRKSISFYQLYPSSDRESPLSWTHSMDFQICQYTTDSAQDLIVVVELPPHGSEFAYTSHMRTISTNQPHPRAGMLTHNSLPRSRVDPVAFWPSVKVQIAGDFIALLVRNIVIGNCGFLEIWNWTEATPPHRCELSDIGDITDIIFLSTTTILITCPHNGRVELYDFDDPAISSNGMTCRGRFNFPLLQPGFQYSHMSANYCSPVGGTLTPIPSFKKSLFHPFPEDRICVLKVFITDTRRIGGTDGDHLVYIHVRAFFGSDPKLPSLLRESEDHSVPWNAWGPSNTRWGKSWCHAAYGLRVIDMLVERLSRDSFYKKLRLLDFNSYTLSSSVPHSGASLESLRQGRVVTEGSRIPAGPIFHEDVNSYLPYREVITEEHLDIDTVVRIWMDENRIVLLQVLYDCVFLHHCRLDS
ncbi:hypothetical protein PILCRDRAFT_821845 [Piloderma croceum F 1598]|uniref:F-box domain-containing protein n=1 Tax=Piloderma croceum (strain F 1598) TaxID=765440 RepID=A0A0C3B451_PILCF|nr:hypothetical protein PILCRDRAFT_821845 [Piloderma croceum F 1598]